MKRILFSLSTLVLIGAAVAGGTGAFFSDTEASIGNTFTAGAIDLKVDNESYYNGVFSTTTSWSLADLTIQKFFDFDDLKPGDTGEDTISLHVDTNDAYLCANVKLTSNNENGCNEPEAPQDASCANPGAGQGELASNVNFLWWADDGDNVLEVDEEVISQGPIGALGLGGSTTIALADSQNNIWTGTGGPVPGQVTQYIGKAWCFGTLGTAPLSQSSIPAGRPTTTPAQNGNGILPAGQPEDGGITCNGSGLNNVTQTDSLTADVTFTAVQARHNDNFLCVPPRPTGKLVVKKVVVNNNGGNNVVGDFGLFVFDGIVPTAVVSGATTTLPIGTYNVSESGAAGYQASFSGACNAVGNVTIGAGEEKTCTITNTELPASITLIKDVTGTPPLVPNTIFNLRVDGVLTPTGASVAVTSNTPHFIGEDGFTGYHFVSITGTGCPVTTSTPIILSEGQAITCTITNAKD